MSVAIKLLSPTLLSLIVLPDTSFALSCKENQNNSAQITAALGTNLAIPADAPNGTIIWESEQRTIQVICKDDRKVGRSETVYFYVNPENISIGQGIRVGIRYKNQTIVQGSGKYNTGMDSWYGCNWGNCSGWEAKFPLTFSVFIEKFGTTPPSGVISTTSNYRVFQLDGDGGLNTTPNSNVNYVVSGLNNIRFVACKADLKITPETLNFGRIALSMVQSGKIASSRAFTIGLNRWCNTPYTVNARFTPFNGEILEGKLVPKDNPSVGISVRNLQNNTEIPFSQWFKLTELTGQNSSNDFQADLVWRNNSPIGGKFNAGVTVDLYYQ